MPKERVVGLICAFLRNERLGITAATFAAELHEKYPGCVPDGDVDAGDLERLLGEHEGKQAAAAEAGADGSAPAQVQAESRPESEDESGDEGWRGALGLTDRDDDDDEDAEREAQGRAAVDGGAQKAVGTTDSPAKERDWDRHESGTDERAGRRSSASDTQTRHASTSRNGDSSVGEREVMRREAHRGGDRKEETPRSRGDRGALDRLNAKPAPRSAAPSASPVQPRDARERDRAARERDRNAAPRVQDEKGKLDGAARSSAGLRQADAGRGEDALNVTVESHNGWRRQLYRPHQPSPLAAGSC
jgi:hypothetical protein